MAAQERRYSRKLENPQETPARRSTIHLLRSWFCLDCGIERIPDNDNLHATRPCARIPRTLFPSTRGRDPVLSQAPEETKLNSSW